MSNSKRLRRLIKIAEIILRLLFVIAMIVSIIKFSFADEVFDAVWYGIWMIVGLIATLRE